MTKLELTVVFVVMIACVGIVNSKEERILKRDTVDTNTDEGTKETVSRVKKLSRALSPEVKDNAIPMTKSLCSLFDGFYTFGECYVNIGKKSRRPRFKGFGNKKVPEPEKKN